jgi:ring-1,2-phenylacetyl-CoA epoxidase subunit PaaD
MVTAQPTKTQIWEWLKQIPDPEIPVLSIVDLAIVREVEWSSDDTELVITVTPTYCGCPAMDVIVSNIRSVLAERGIDHLSILSRLSPAWTTDWISQDAKSRLREYGIAPPGQRLIPANEIERLHAAELQLPCPRCGSNRTSMVSRFGSTPCKALYKCLDCLEPFDAFKQH